LKEKPVKKKAIDKNNYAARRKFLKKIAYLPPAIATLTLDKNAQAQGQTPPPPPFFLPLPREPKENDP